MKSKSSSGCSHANPRVTFPCLVLFAREHFLTKWLKKRPKTAENMSEHPRFMDQSLQQRFCHGRLAGQIPWAWGVLWWWPCSECLQGSWLGG